VVRKKFLFVFLFVLFCKQGFAQDTFKYALFSQQMHFVNPAYAGVQTQAVLSTRNQWVSVENAPKTTSFAIGAPLKNNLGGGLSILNNSLFIENKTIASGDVSYKLTLNQDSQLYLGMRGGGYFYKVDPLSLITSSGVSDPSQQTQAYFAPIIGAGAYWTYKNYWASYSIPQLIKIGTLDPAINSVINVQHYAAAGIELPLSDNFQWKGAVIYRKSQGFKGSQQFATAVAFLNSFELGASYYSSGNAALTGQLQIADFFTLGYAYERGVTNSIGGLDRRTHEVFLSVQLDNFLGNTTAPASNEGEKEETEEN
jgi:type IX secretion system PorP/SprF family membrane protein